MGLTPLLAPSGLLLAGLLSANSAIATQWHTEIDAVPVVEQSIDMSLPTPCAIQAMLDQESDQITASTPSVDPAWVSMWLEAMTGEQIDELLAETTCADELEFGGDELAEADEEMVEALIAGLSEECYGELADVEAAAGKIVPCKTKKPPVGPCNFGKSCKTFSCTRKNGKKGKCKDSVVASFAIHCLGNTRYQYSCLQECPSPLAALVAGMLSFGALFGFRRQMIA